MSMDRCDAPRGRVGTPVRIRRLSWAGTEITTGGQRLLIDALNTAAPLGGFLGLPRWPLVEIEEIPGRTDALVTHIHPDHFDPDTLRRVLSDDGVVHCHQPIVPILRAAGLLTHGVELWCPLAIGDGTEVTAVPAVDWRGDDQVSWVVRAGDRQVFHGGDTIWHGSWWAIAKRFRRFDCAFLPVNGVIAVLPNFAPSGLPATLTPHQAVIAARLLHADTLCPIHYGQFNNPPVYVEQPNVEGELRTAAAREGVHLSLIPDGATFLTLSPRKSKISCRRVLLLRLRTAMASRRHHDGPADHPCPGTARLDGRAASRPHHRHDRVRAGRQADARLPYRAGPSRGDSLIGAGCGQRLWLPLVRVRTPNQPQYTR